MTKGREAAAAVTLLLLTIELLDLPKRFLSLLTTPPVIAATERGDGDQRLARAPAAAEDMWERTARVIMVGGWSRVVQRGKFLRLLRAGELVWW